MNILIAPDSFKGSLSASAVCSAISKGISRANSKINITQFPSSDGGEGFCDCMKNIFGGRMLEREVTYPSGKKGTAEFLFIDETKTAYIELASAAGLSLVPINERNILSSSTYGVGELIINAIDCGAEKIIVGLGGSATNDCGIGMLAALGLRFFDKDNSLLEPIPTSLANVAYCDKSNMIDLSKISFIAACDVKNPLCGKNGAAEVFSRQKGATDAEAAYLDESARLFANALDINPDLPGSGAAGGVGAAMLSILGAKYISGASILVNSGAFIKALENANLLITGEGNTDYQTVNGKLVSVVASAAKKTRVPVIVISGGLSEGYQILRDNGVVKFYSLLETGMDVEYCINHASQLIEEISITAVNEFLD